MEARRLLGCVNYVDFESGRSAFEVDGHQYHVDVVRTGAVALFRASDIGTALGMSAIRSSVRAFAKHEKVVELHRASDGPRFKAVFLTYAGVRRLLAKSRKPAAAVLAKAFGMLVHDNHYVCVEAAALTFLSQALKGLSMRQQFHVGRYRIDLYFPKHKLALECDEEGSHGLGRVSQDHERQKYIEKQLKCTFLRFCPQQQGFSMAGLLNSVLRGLRLIPNQGP
jgi:very-short-patch-repair endonuclease